MDILTKIICVFSTIPQKAILMKSSIVVLLPMMRRTMESFEYPDVVNVNVEIWEQLIYHKNKWMSKSLKSMIEYIKDHEFLS